MTSTGTETMSAREAEVLDALGEHLTNAEIAQRLHISVRTVESHVSSLLRKLAAADRRELAARAAEIGSAAPRDHQQLTGVPATWTTFIGRDTELGEVAAALTSHRLVTLVGPGGIGKTRLAGAAAERAAPAFPGGGAFVNLVPVRAEFVVEAAAAALGVVERAQEDLEGIVHDRLRRDRVLLILDNCEHVLGAAAEFVQAVLVSCPDAVVLATSRERLGVSGERVVPVPPLGTVDDGRGSEAGQLFIDRAASAAGVDADPVLVAEVCRRLDGMPLAIELAAARSASLGIDGLLAGLDDHLRLLSRSAASDDRHGSLRTVIDWSHELLDDDERAVFRRLGVFAGAFDLAAAATIATDGDLATASDVIGRLADKSLLVHDPAAEGSRWRMLETVHAYALEKLASSDEERDVRQRHFVWAAATAVALEQSLDDDGGWQVAFDAVADDLRGALTATAPGSQADGADYHLALALGHLTYARRFLAEARNHYDEATVRAPDEAAAIAALRIAADAAFAEMRGETAFEILTGAFERAAAAGDDATAATVLADAAAIAGRCPATFITPVPYERIVALTEQARSIAPAGDVVAGAHVALAAAWNGHRAPVVPDVAAAEEALRQARALDDPVLTASALDAVGAAIGYDGRYKEASRLARERVALLDRLPRHDPHVGGEVADIFHMASEAAMSAGEIGTALTAARAAHDDAIGQGLAHFAATHLVVPLALRGEFDEALVHAAIMREGWERSGSPAAGWMSPSFFATALIHGLRGDEEAYDRWWSLAMEFCSRSRASGFALFVAPRVALHLGYVDRAAELARAADTTTYDCYGPYGQAMAVEVAVVAGEADAADRLRSARPLAAENDVVAACLARAEGRLHDDEAALVDALSRWDALGARFERACTLLLLPDRADEGRAELHALRCPLPAS